MSKPCLIPRYWLKRWVEQNIRPNYFIDQDSSNDYKAMLNETADELLKLPDGELLDVIMACTKEQDDDTN